MGGINARILSAGWFKTGKSTATSKTQICVNGVPFPRTGRRQGSVRSGFSSCSNRNSLQLLSILFIPLSVVPCRTSLVYFRLILRSTPLVNLLRREAFSSKKKSISLLTNKSCPFAELRTIFRRPWSGPTNDLTVTDFDNPATTTGTKRKKESVDERVRLRDHFHPDARQPEGQNTG